MIAAIDLIRCLRNRKAFTFIERTKVPVGADGRGVPVLIQALNKAWSMAPDGIGFLSNAMITPYLPTELQEDSVASVRDLLDSTSVFYETEKAVRIAYAIVSTRKLASTVEKVYQESSTPLELESNLKNAFIELSQLEVYLKRGLNDDDTSNSISLHSNMEGKSLYPSTGASRVCASVGGDLDVVLGGGLDEGTYNIFLGSKGEGKTWTACCVAARNARMGRHTAFFTLENSKYSITDRTMPLYLEMPFFMASYRTFKTELIKSRVEIVNPEVLDNLISMHVSTATPIIGRWAKHFLVEAGKLQWPMTPLEAIENLHVPFYDALDLLIAYRKPSLKGSLDVFHFPSNVLKVSDVERILEGADKDYKLIVVDYLNAVQVPPQSTRHEHLGWFADELRRLASQTKSAIWLNAQLKRGFKMFSKAANKGGLDEEVFYEFVAESFKAVWGADYVMILMGLVGGLVKNNQRGGFKNFNRAVILNRARENECGDWFGWDVNLGSGTYEVSKTGV